MRKELARAFVTLERGAQFLGAGLRAPPNRKTEAPAVVGRYRARVIGNGLRELDRFLNLLIDEARHARGLVVYPGQRNTANKLAAYRAALRQSHPDDARLRALGRTRACLFHCSGRVVRGDTRGEAGLTVGWPEQPGTDGPLRRFTVGSEIEASPQDLDDVSAFYLNVAFEIAEPLLEFPQGQCYMQGATVAN